nr:leucine-rich repeat domain-containing protein [Treponema sp.]
NGYITMHCTRCGENWTEKYKDAHGHVYTDTNEYEWGFAGKKYIRRCVYCGKQEMEPGRYGLFTYNTYTRKYEQTNTWDDLLNSGIFSIDKNGTLILDGVNTKTKESKHASELNGTLVLPETVKRLDSSSLYYLDGITELYIPSTVDTISFHYGSIRNLEEIHVSKDSKSFVVTNNALYSIDHKRLVAAMKHYDGAFKVDDRCKEISKYALYNTNYWYVYIPEGVEKIGDSAFKDMNNIVTIEIPSTVTTIGKGLMNFSGKLKRIDVVGANPKYTSVYGSLYSADLKTILNVPNTKTGKFEILETVSRIEANAFDHCNKLTQIIIPERVNYIGGFAFADCVGLKSLKLPAGITHIYEGTLSKVNCSVVIPASVEFIGYQNTVNNSVKFEDTTHKWKMQLTKNGKTSKSAPSGEFSVDNASNNKKLLNDCMYYEWIRQ